VKQNILLHTLTNKEACGLVPDRLARPEKAPENSIQQQVQKKRTPAIGKYERSSREDDDHESFSPISGEMANQEPHGLHDQHHTHPAKANELR
jgi:hypothetical protein